MWGRNMKKTSAPCEDVDRYILGNARCRFLGLTDKTMKFVENNQLLNAALWKRFVKQFRVYSDSEDNGWRGEYWGKMMRGACFVYSYTQNQELYDTLKETVRDIMESCDEYGRISTYTLEREFSGWDIWSRKYVLLGMQYFLEISGDSQMKTAMVQCMCRQVDYIMSLIGPREEGKKPITEATNHWRGLNSVSILEPVVRLYNLTREEKYLAFAEYIAGTGGTSVENVFALALANKLYPYQYPVTKAYEMTSCFEGLLELYRVKKVAWHKQAVINFANRILESDFTIIGSSGCTHELFDHSTVRQANTTNGKIMQETCVTVTLMKFFYQLTLLTGDATFADAFERSFYNAYLGAVNTEMSVEPTIKEILPNAVIEALPFDSYSPLTAGTRGNGIGGLKLMPDMHYYGCCACIGAAGIGIVPRFAYMNYAEGVVVNMYIPGTAEMSLLCGDKVSLEVDTEYPKEGTVNIKMNHSGSRRFCVRLRNPHWSRQTKIRIANKRVDTEIMDGKLQRGEKDSFDTCNIQMCDGYIELCADWSNGDEIELCFDMRTEAIYPVSYDHEVLMNKVVWGQNYMVPTYDEEDPLAKKHIALRRGPLMLAVCSRLGYDPGGSFDIALSSEGYIDVRRPEKEKAPYEHMVELEVPLSDGGYFTVTDYASAGKLWTEEDKIAAWIRRES